MQAFHILDIKPFMQFLFQPGELDSYDFVSAQIHMDMDYSINGLLDTSFYTEDELENFQIKDAVYLPWSLARDKIFHIIKGKKTPGMMKIVLRLSDSQIKDMISQNSTFTPNDIDGMYINIIFQHQKLNVICGISYKIFSLDKSLEDILTKKITTLLKSKSITYENQN